MNLSTILAINVATLYIIGTELFISYSRCCEFHLYIMNGHTKLMLFEFYWFCKVTCI